MRISDCKSIESENLNYKFKIGNMDKNTKILIADDSAFMRKILRGFLEGMGFSQFVECEDGKDCVEKYEAEKPGLVLLDIIMPEMGGLDVLKKIGRSAKVLVISAVGQDKMINEAKQLGAAGYIVKPFDKKKVEDEIMRVLE